MADITKCTGLKREDKGGIIICPFRKRCERFTAPDSGTQQSWLTETPLIWEQYPSCEMGPAEAKRADYGAEIMGESLRTVLLRKAEKLGSVEAAAQEVGLSPAFVSEIIQRYAPGKRG